MMVTDRKPANTEGFSTAKASSRSPSPLAILAHCDCRTCTSQCPEATLPAKSANSAQTSSRRSLRASRSSAALPPGPGVSR